MYKKPRLNQKVYIITHDPVNGFPWGVYKTSVYLMNNEVFATPYIKSKDMSEELRTTYFFADYGITWFTSLKEIKKYIQELFTSYGYKYYNFKKESDGLWDISVGGCNNV